VKFEKSNLTYLMLDDKNCCQSVITVILYFSDTGFAFKKQRYL